MASCKVHDLPDFGFCDLVAEHANHGDSLFVHYQHDIERLRVGHAKEPFQNVNDKLHRGEIVIQQQHLIQGRTFGTRARLYQDRGVAIVTGAAGSTGAAGGV